MMYSCWNVLDVLILTLSGHQSWEQSSLAPSENSEAPSQILNRHLQKENEWWPWQKTQESFVNQVSNLWYFVRKITKGMHKWMGDIVGPDKALSLEILHEIIELLDEDWCNKSHDWFNIALEGAFYLIAFCCGLRGEEIPLTDLTGITRNWEEPKQRNNSWSGVSKSTRSPYQS